MNQKKHLGYSKALSNSYVLLATALKLKAQSLSLEAQRTTETPLIYGNWRAILLLQVEPLIIFTQSHPSLFVSMLLSKLPPEVILNISLFLPLKDRDSCCFVCRAWKGPFQESMHYDLTLGSIGAIYNSWEELVDSESIKQYTGTLLRSLTLSDCRNLSVQQLGTLQRTFPNVKSVWIQKLCCSSNLFERETDWLLWRSLTELRVDILLYRTIHVEVDNPFLGIICNLSMLTRLQLINSVHYESCINQIFRLSEFELIHTRLVHLTHLELSSRLLSISGTEIQRMGEVSPANKIKLFRMISSKTDHQWLYYFAKKYPNLESFNFSTISDELESEKQRNNIISLLQSLTHPFQHLKALYLGDKNYLPKEYLLYYDMINCFKPPLERIYIYIFQRNLFGNLSKPLSALNKLFRYMCSSRLSGSLKDLCVLCPEVLIITTLLIKRKDTFYNLVHLKLSCPFQPFNLDDLLDKRNFLKTLDLRFAKIEINPKALKRTKRRSLQSFTATRSEITSDVLRYLSFQCRDLNTLYLHRTKVFGKFNSTQGCHFIDMSYTRFNLLRFVSVPFIIKDNPINGHNINITLITRPVDDIPPKNDDSVETLPISFESSSFKVHYDWLYSLNSSMRPLPKAASKNAEEFFMNFEDNKELFLNTYVPNPRTEKINLNKWKYDPKCHNKTDWKLKFIYGYTRIKCGYVANFALN
ncbi:hypothetical protein J3Q64DRAFT_1701562 [Phycomyces blakesleeanus]|uniref:F-box domain-containing protein n=1 Tax=Phycomyces blakesleeanus TaxID=4837 RepID=A0ABR3ARQ4_PHYBL